MTKRLGAVPPSYSFPTNNHAAPGHGRIQVPFSAAYCLRFQYTLTHKNIDIGRNPQLIMRIRNGQTRALELAHGIYLAKSSRIVAFSIEWMFFPLHFRRHRLVLDLRNNRLWYTGHVFQSRIQQCGQDMLPCLIQHKYRQSTTEMSTSSTFINISCATNVSRTVFYLSRCRSLCFFPQESILLCVNILPTYTNAHSQTSTPLS